MGLLPPFGEPAGAECSVDELVRGFARGGHDGVARPFHVEGPVLLVDDDQPIGLRLQGGAVLVRTDTDDEYGDQRAVVEQALEADGLSLLAPDTDLAAVVAIQIVGLRASNWDLWGEDQDAAFAALRAAAAGDESAAVFGT